MDKTGCKCAECLAYYLCPFDDNWVLTSKSHVEPIHDLYLSVGLHPCLTVWKSALDAERVRDADAVAALSCSPAFGEVYRAPVAEPVLLKHLKQR